MTRNGGSMADAGSVSYLFNRKGVILVSRTAATEDQILEATLDAGAQEVNDLGETFEIICEATDLVEVRSALQAVNIDYESAEASFVPSMTVPVDDESAAKIFKLLEALEDSDEVQTVYANFEASDRALAQA
jgi:transcriptional/translational regulatory protein YebC/TACO1